MGKSKAMVFGRRGVMMVLCVVMLAVGLSQVEQSDVSAATTTINFDDVTARGDFANSAPLTDQYAALGVTFSGPSAGTGGAVLNQSSGFFVAGISNPNFLAFSVDAGYPIGPETITFADPVQRVSIKAGAPDEGLVVLAAYDGATMLGVDAAGLSSMAVTLEVAYERITHVMIVFTSRTLVVDDLTWTIGNPPTISVPDNMADPNTTGQAGAIVTYDASAIDDEDGPLTPNCSPASGSFFPLGPTTVACSVIDSDGDSGSAGFTVTVNDTEAPIVTVPADITASADGDQTGAVVTYPPATATDNSGAAITPVCTPASGEIFSLGTTTVTCTATDAANNTGSATFLVTVSMPDAGDLLVQLRADTIALVADRATERALLVPLDQAQTALSTGNRLRAYGALLTYRAQLDWYTRLGRIPPDVAQQLQAQAQQVMDAMW